MLECILKLTHNKKIWVYCHATRCSLCSLCCNDKTFNHQSWRRNGFGTFTWVHLCLTPAQCDARHTYHLSPDEDFWPLADRGHACPRWECPRNHTGDKGHDPLRYISRWNCGQITSISVTTAAVLWYYRHFLITALAMTCRLSSPVPCGLNPSRWKTLSKSIYKGVHLTWVVLLQRTAFSIRPNAIKMSNTLKFCRRLTTNCVRG